MTTMPMLTCGCRASSIRNYGKADARPSCIVHDCDEVAMIPPDLSTRRARCTYYGKPTYKNECNYGQGSAKICTCEQPSADPLPFFRYHGDGSPKALDTCTCGFHRNAHDPLWSITVHFDRNWYKKGRIDFPLTHTHHAPDYATALLRAQGMIDGWGHDTNPETEVFGAKIGEVKQILNTLKCKAFTPIGPQPFDEFYCGCHSWD